MVLVASGPHGSGNASGSIGPDTYSHNRYGQYVRNRTKPINPNTARQQVVRAALATLTTRWSQTLTAAQRTAWNLYGQSVVMKNKLGQDMLVTGFAHYLRSNVPLLQASEAPVDAAPTLFEIPEQDPTLAITISEATQLYSVTFDAAAAWCDEDDAYMLILGGSPQNPQRNFFAGPWRYAGKIEGDLATPPTSPKTIATPFHVDQGQRCWIQARILRADGRISTPFSVSVVAGA